MRATRRDQRTQDYWTKRWRSIPVDNAMANPDVYPLKFALNAMCEGGSVLEAGCGNGRILRALLAAGYDAYGCDYVQDSIDLIREADPSARVQWADVRDLPYADGQFTVVLAFGVVHGLEVGSERAMAEFHRVLAPGGRLIVSLRANNLNTVVSDFLWKLSNRSFSSKHFHKFNVSRREARSMVEGAGFGVQAIQPVVNVPLAYRFPILRRGGRFYNEALSRENGYQMNLVGQAISSMLDLWFPTQMNSLWVLDATKDA